MNRISRWIAVLLVAAPCVTVWSAEAQALSEARLKQACVTLQRAPLDSAELQVLLDTSRLATNTPALRSRAMAAYSLTLLMLGNTNAFERAVQIQRETFPEDQALIDVGRDAYLALCGDCAGSGLTKALCPSCMGSGKCKACAGAGVRKSAEGKDVPCPACKRSGVCAMCAGKQKIETPCPTCKGTCRVFKLSEKIRGNYTALLTNMVARCQDNEDFAEQFKKAAGGTDAAARIQALQAVLQRFAHRTDLAPVNDLLEKEVKKRDERIAEQRKQQEQEQAQRELEALRNLGESKDPAQAIATLRTYLAGHPGSANRIELQTMLDALEAKQAHHATVKKITYGALALLGALLLIQLIRPLLFRRTTGVSTVRDIDRTQFSDPLTLTSAESRARGKAETSDTEPEE